MKFYTGIGSRETPSNVLKDMVMFGSWLGEEGYILRSGGAGGADSAFEKGCDYVQGKKEIYLPWKMFNNNRSPLYVISPATEEIASRFHPAWNRCSSAVKKLHSRNVSQVLGQDLETPSLFVICYHKGSGGTTQACRIAEAYKIPIFNLYTYEVSEAIKEIKSLDK